MIKEDIMAKKKKCKNKNKKSNTYDNNNSNFSNDYEMSEFDIKSLKLLQLQILIIFINIYANFILYISSLQGIDLFIVNTMVIMIMNIKYHQIKLL